MSGRGNQNNEDLQNNLDILDIISQVYGSGSAFAGNFIRVGLASNSVGDLVGALRGELRNNTELANENTDNSTRMIVNVLGNSSRDIGQSIRELATAQGKLEDAIKNRLFNLLSHPFQYITSHIPAIGKYISFIGTTLDTFLSLQTSNLNVYKELIQNSVLYQKSFKQMHEDAGYLGMDLNELKETLIKNRTFYIKLGALTGDSSDAFTKLTKSVKDTSISLGLDMKDSVSMASTVVQNMYDKMDVSSDSFDRLIETTNSYQKFLQKLSLATGISVEELNKANEAKEKDIAFQAWQKDSRNAPINSFLTGIHATPELIDAFVRGMPNEAFVRAGAYSPEMARILQRAMEINNDNTLSMEDKEYLLTELMKSADKSALSEPLQWDRPFLSAFSKANGPYYGTRIIAMNEEGFDFSGTNETIIQMTEFKNKIIQIFEKIKAAFSLDSDVINGSTNFLINFNKFLDEMLNNADGKESKFNKIMNNINNFINEIGTGMGKLLEGDTNINFGDIIKKNIFGATMKEDGTYESWTEIFKGILKPIFDGFMGALIETIWSWMKDHWIISLAPLGLLFSNKILGISSLIVSALRRGYEILTSSRIAEMMRGVRTTISSIVSGTISRASGLISGITSIVMAHPIVAGILGASAAVLYGLTNDKELDKKYKSTQDKRYELNQKLQNGEELTQEEKEFLATRYGAGVFGSINAWWENPHFWNNYGIGSAEDEYNMRMHQIELSSRRAQEKRQADEMKAREEAQKEAERQKEELKKQLEDAENENKKSELECLRSIDTKLDILMNLDGKYTGILNEARNLRIGNELLNLTEMNPQEA